jgi:excisionase family DNA binding protein
MSPRPLASEPAASVESPYLTAKEAAIYLRFATVRALYSAVKRERIPVCYRGTSLLFHRADLDRWLAGESVPERRLRHTDESRRFSRVSSTQTIGERS